MVGFYGRYVLNLHLSHWSGVFSAFFVFWPNDGHGVLGGGLMETGLARNTVTDVLITALVDALMSLSFGTMQNPPNYSQAS